MHAVQMWIMCLMWLERKISIAEKNKNHAKLNAYFLFIFEMIDVERIGRGGLQ